MVTEVWEWLIDQGVPVVLLSIAVVLFAIGYLIRSVGTAVQAAGPTVLSFRHDGRRPEQPAVPELPESEKPRKELQDPS